MSKAKELSQLANKVLYNDGTNKVSIDSVEIPQSIFKNIAVSGQSDVVADGTSDTLTLVAGTNMTLTTDAGTDTITLASAGSGGTQNLFSTFAVAGQNSIVADSTTDTLTLAAGTGITLTTDQATDTLTITSTAGSGTLSNIVEDTSPQLGGNLESNGSEIQMADNNKIALGTSERGYLQHTGASGKVQLFSTVGGIDIRTTANDEVIAISSDDGSGGIANYIIADGSTGATELYFYGSKKLETTTGGVTVTGTVNGHTIPGGSGTLALTSNIPSDTDGLSEGSTNVYYTNARVDTHLNTASAATGEILSWTGTDYAWTGPGGGGGTPAGSDTFVQFNSSGSFGADSDFTYNQATNVLTVGSINATATGTPTLTSNSAINMSVGSSVIIQQNSGGGGFRLGNMTTTERNALAAANGEMVYNTTDNKLQGYENGAWANIISTGGIASVVADTTPQLGGDLDVNGNDIVSASNGDIEVKPNGSGDIRLVATTGTTIITRNNGSTSNNIDNMNVTLNSDSTTTGTSVGIGLHPGTDTSSANLFSYLRTTRTSNTSADFSIHVANESSPAGTYYVTTYYGNNESGRVDFPGNVKVKADGVNHSSVKVGAANVFNITAPNQPNHYTFNDPDSHWFPTAEDDPALTLRRGETYYFVVNASGHPFEIRDGNGGTAITQGITNNTTAVGTIIFKVPMNPTDLTLYYQCTAHGNMGAVINIV